MLTCEKCSISNNTVKKERQNTCYTNDMDNYITLCINCKEENDNYWNERWKEYWQDVL